MAHLITRMLREGRRMPNGKGREIASVMRGIKRKTDMNNEAAQGAVLKDHDESI